MGVTYNGYKTKNISCINKYCTYLQLLFEELYDLKKLYLNFNNEDKRVYCNKAICVLINKIIISKIFIQESNIKDELVKNNIKYYTLTLDTIELSKLAFKNVDKKFLELIFKDNIKYETINPSYKNLENEYFLESECSFIYRYNTILDKIIEQVNKFDFINNSSEIGEIYEAVLPKEYKKSMGIFYTPEYIIDYILDNVFYEFSPLENPFVRVIDISAGAGYFIIKAYDKLKRIFLENIKALQEKYKESIYTIKKRNETIRLTGEYYWQEENLYYHIINNCIYAADIDIYATQIIAINLFIKERKFYINKVNVVNCDSLIKWEEDFKPIIKYLNNKYKLKVYKIKNKDIDKPIHYKEKEDCDFKRCFKLYKFWKNKFDYIIGNPPWVSLSRKNKKACWESSLEYYIKNYGQCIHSPNLFEYFIKRALEKTKKRGYLAFVVPLNFSRNFQYKQLRNEILNGCEIKNLLFNISFSGVVTDGMVFILKNNRKCFNEIKIKVEGKAEYEICKNELFSCNEYGFAFDNNSYNQNIKNKILENTNFLSEISNTFTGFIGNSKNIYKENIDNSYIKIYKGKNIKKFICHSCFFYDFKYGNIKGGTKNLKKLKYKGKILVRKTGNEIIAAYDKEGIIIEQSLYGIIDLKENFNYKYILGILNSQLMNWYYKNYLITNKESTPQLKKYRLDKIPIKKCADYIQQKIGILVDEISKNLKNKNIKEAEYYYKILNKKIFKIYGIDDIKTINYIININHK
ncbi:TaqI-like C-terminal specificity domain-containing protein [Clostridium tepidum]|uniref:site-specific DNA-methyltransferase (adenine-specific) n=1 Tax=Clostridium tepidum TaxID=1962263 RepID=A0A1S9I163_9CLOT|nr:TaqI-like C-terminal specificity domain-containing protein [Clostridium tepidum]MDU6878239.1 TaqI-like C-terminal specificity domain-containing protein [Clostridium botulinum]OOO61464.1 restriction endonuclease [Clostridium tepidum]OOO64037.1 restriction endonuclease [Clostridium tepidum]